MKTSDFDYALPPDRIATAPSPSRDGARLLVLDRRGGAWRDAFFREIAAFLPQGALIVLNDTRVIPARIRGTKPSGGKTELLLVRRIAAEAPSDGGFSEIWEALGRGLPRSGGPVTLAGGLVASVLESHGQGRIRVRLTGGGGSNLLELLGQVGEVPLPPYIEAARREQGGAQNVDDRERYQTVYSSVPGAVAAPTAGLHFTPELLATLAEAGHPLARLTLHVGPGTFRPVKSEDPAAHEMDEEHYDVPVETARAVAEARASGRRIVAVGTTVVRALESAARVGGGEVPSGPGATRLFIRPGDALQVVTDLVTNFHLPRSTLLMLVAAFAGRERVLAAYHHAIESGYRFYSYGDAMLITGEPS